MRYFKRVIVFLVLTITLISIYASNSNRLCHVYEQEYPTVEYETIPSYIHMTAKSIDHVYPKVIKMWTEKNPTYEYKIYNDAEIDAIVKEYMPADIYEAFQSLPVPVLKADYFRYIILYLKGGVYSDTDTLCLRSIDNWTDGIANVDMIVSIEQFDPEVGYYCRDEGFARDIQFIQWTMASRKGHPILWSVINKIKEITPKMLNQTSWNNCDILDWTGPGIWSDAILEHLNLEDVYELDIEKGKLIDGIYFLPRVGFTSGDESFYYEGRVQHLFWGSWKKSKASKLYSSIERWFYLYFRC
ncbi:hypothetical protein K502DRAFT_325468 [Neoconidiobolus thromboides FSU 785]|nr:hypothetical protein K502DRAFT_325468 [Neoconidiobolus thromboides FSU 785]